MRGAYAGKAVDSLILGSPCGLIQTPMCVDEHEHSIYDKGIEQVVRSLQPAGMEYPDPRSHKHGDIIKEVVKRLETTGDYCFILTNQKYFGICDDLFIRNGEMDVFCIGYDGRPVFSYFEIKSGHNKDAVQKANRQFSQWRSFMHATHRVPYDDLETVLITPVTLDLVLPQSEES